MPKTRAYAPTLRRQRVSADLARYFDTQEGESVALSALDAGGDGDCLFHSIAAIVEKIIFETPHGATRFEPHLGPEDFSRDKAFVVTKLRGIVADQLIQLQPEVFINIIVSSLNQEASGSWLDEWSPATELHRTGFGFLVEGRANVVEAIGENEDGAPGDMLVQYTNGATSAVRVLKNGAVLLAQLQELRQGQRRVEHFQPLHKHRHPRHRRRRHSRAHQAQGCGSAFLACRSAARKALASTTTWKKGRAQTVAHVRREYISLAQCQLIRILLSQHMVQTRRLCPKAPCPRHARTHRPCVGNA